MYFWGMGPPRRTSAAGRRVPSRATISRCEMIASRFPLDRLRGAGGVNGRKNLVAGVGGAQGNPQRVHIAKFADQHNVRVLPQRLAEGLLKTWRVGPDFQLRDQRELGRMQIFDRVLDADDLGCARLIDQFDHRRQRGRFAGAGRARDQGQPSPGQGDFVDDCGKMQFGDAGDFGFDQTHGDAGAAQLAVARAAEPANPRRGIGKIQPGYEPLVNIFPIPRRRDGGDELRNLLVGQRRLIDGVECAGDPQFRRKSALDMNIRSPAIRREAHQRLEIHATSRWEDRLLNQFTLS
jgi:hypothetical protein